MEVDTRASPESSAWRSAYRSNQPSYTCLCPPFHPPPAPSQVSPSFTYSPTPPTKSHPFPPSVPTCPMLCHFLHNPISRPHPLHLHPQTVIIFEHRLLRTYGRRLAGLDGGTFSIGMRYWRRGEGGALVLDWV